MTLQAPAGWYPDPTGRYDLRYWDESSWTHHVVRNHVQGVDPLTPAPPQVSIARDVKVSVTKPKKKIARQVRKADVRTEDEPGGGTLLTERVLVINQKPKRFEQLVEYAIFDQHGNRLGEARETGLNYLFSAVSFRTASTRKRELEVVDSADSVIYRLTRPAKTFKPKVHLLRDDGTEIARFSQNGLFSRKLTLEVGDKPVGMVRFADGYTFRATVVDDHGDEVAEVTRTWAGRRSERKTRADNYVLELKRSGLSDPMRGLVISTAVAIDLLFQQGEPSAEDAKMQKRARRWL